MYFLPGLSAFIVAHHVHNLCSCQNDPLAKCCACTHTHTYTHPFAKTCFICAPVVCICAPALQRAWRSAAAARKRRTGGVHFPRTPDKEPSRGARSGRLKGWLRGRSSTNTGFGRSLTDDRGEAIRLGVTFAGPFLMQSAHPLGSIGRNECFWAVWRYCGGGHREGVEEHFVYKG
eukprot:1161521-Pelagomonas_calceolata.AAC.6